MVIVVVSVVVVFVLVAASAPVVVVSLVGVGWGGGGGGSRCIVTNMISSGCVRRIIGNRSSKCITCGISRARVTRSRNIRVRISRNGISCVAMCRILISCSRSRIRGRRCISIGDRIRIRSRRSRSGRRIFVVGCCHIAVAPPPLFCMCTTRWTARVGARRLVQVRVLLLIAHFIGDISASPIGRSRSRSRSRCCCSVMKCCVAPPQLFSVCMHSWTSRLGARRFMQVRASLPNALCIGDITASPSGCGGDSN